MNTTLFTPINLIESGFCKNYKEAQAVIDEYDNKKQMVVLEILKVCQNNHLSLCQIQDVLEDAKQTANLFAYLDLAAPEANIPERE